MKKFILTAFILVSGTPLFCQDLMFVFLNKKENKAELPKDEVTKIMEGHMANINRLAKEGKLVAAGPFEGGGGIFIFKSTSVAQTQEWLSTDPGVQARRWDVEVLPYTPLAGSVCAVGEPYEMVMYSFTRFGMNKTVSALAKQKHEKYLQELTASNDVKVIAQGSFGTDAGGILITAEDASAKLAEDSAIKSGDIRADFKKLYIAKGSFCEK